MTTGAIRCAKLQSSHIITTNKTTLNVLQAGCPFCRPTNSVKALLSLITSKIFEALTVTTHESGHMLMDRFNFVNVVLHVIVPHLRGIIKLRTYYCCVSVHKYGMDKRQVGNPSHEVWVAHLFM